MQPYEFKVIGITLESDKGEVRLDGKFHKVYSSQLFLKLPAEELSKFVIGQIYSLVAQPEAIELLPVVETVPLSGVMDSHPTDDDTWGGV